MLERNAPDATFGFGVVFSEETLGSLRDADPETHLEITETFVRWNRVDIRYRDQVLRSRGHSFSAIARKRLLQLLQSRCLALGVDLRFGVEVETLPEADLVVAADGANSFVRRHGEFGTKVEPEGSKYVWFGTDLVFDAFTFVFRETPSRALQRPRVPLRRADEHVHRRVLGGDVASGRARRNGRGREPRVLRAALRQRPRAAASCSPTARSGSTSRR